MKLLNRIDERKAAIFFVLAAIIFNAVFLWAEVSLPAPHFNDEILHQLSVREAGLAIKSGLDPTDFFLSDVTLGYPLFHHYQHLPQVVLAIVNQTTNNFFSVSWLFDVSRYLLLIFFPFAIFWAMRRFGFDYLTAGFSSLISSLVSAFGFFGFNYSSYTWLGLGLYGQLWAMFFLPLALAEIYRTVCQKQHFFLALFFSTIVLLSHLIYGYILLLSVVLFVFLRFQKTEIISRLKKSVVFFVLLGVITSYFFIPLLFNLEYTNISRSEEEWKWSSFGAKEVLASLFKGQLFDSGRFPSLTILFFLSLIWLTILKLYRKENYRLLIILTIFWLFLFFGRPTWGPLLNILPFTGSLHLHRFIGGLHLFAIMLIGAGTAQVWKKCALLKQRKYFLKPVFCVAILALLLPVYSERANFYQENKIWRLETQKAFLEAKEELSLIKETLEDLPPGRSYAGMPNTWGNYQYYSIGPVPLYSLFPEWQIDSFSYSYHSLALTDDVRLHFDDSRPAEYNLFNVRYVLLHKTWTAPEYYSLLREFENYRLYEVPTTGYFDLITAPAVFYGRTEDFYHANSKWFFSKLLESKQHPIIILGQEPEKTFGLPVFPFQAIDENKLNSLIEPQTEKGTILAERKELNKHWVQFWAEEESWLMLKANYHPCWQAYLNHQKVEPVMLAPGFIGIKVPPGNNQALFVYKSPSYRLPFLFFGVFLLLMLFADYKTCLISKKLRLLNI